MQQDERDQVGPYHWRRMEKIESCTYVNTFLTMVRPATGDVLSHHTSFFSSFLSASSHSQIKIVANNKRSAEGASEAN